jgi:hypothetical protein
VPDFELGKNAKYRPNTSSDDPSTLQIRPLDSTKTHKYYYVRKGSEGRLTRLVVCRFIADEFCSHYALVGDYWLSYHAPLAEGETLDGKLSALVESWRRKVGDG